MTRLLLLALVGFTLSAQDTLLKAYVEPTDTDASALSSQGSSSYHWPLAFEEPVVREAKREFKYILIVREWKPGLRSYTPGTSVVESWWNYDTYLFENDKELQVALDWNNGHRWDQRNIIGLWRLSDLARMTLQYEDVEHVEPEHVRERRWKERVWAVKSGPSTLVIKSKPPAGDVK